MAEEKNSLKWWILFTVIIGTFLGRLDQTIVNLAIPKIIDDFAINIAAAGWIGTAYILANAIFVPIWGKLGDTIGRKKVYIFGFSVFIFGSLLAGSAWNLGSMIVFRVIQAIASSADYPTAMAIIAVTFRTGKQRAQALGIWSASFAAAIVFGPLIGGPLIDNFGWRSVFLVNIPIGIIGLLMALIFINESVDKKPTVKFDWWGAISLGIALSAIVLVLEKGLDWGWASNKSLIAYSTAAVFSIIFYFIEIHHDEPIVDFKFFRNKVFVGTLLNNFVIFMGMVGGTFIIPVFVQTFLGYGATETGYLFMPMAAGLMIAAPVGGALAGKIKSQYVIAASTLVSGIGIYLLSFIDARSGPLDIIIPMTIMAFGMGFGMAQRTNAVAAAVPQNEIGIASSVLALVRNIAGAFGIAIFATILTYSTEANVLLTAQNSVINTASPGIISQATSLIILNAQIVGYKTVFLVAAAFMFIGVATSFMIKVNNENKKVEVMIE